MKDYLAAGGPRHASGASSRIGLLCSSNHDEGVLKMAKRGGIFGSFRPVFWLVIGFEFFERGSYYGVMSILSVYLTDILHFAKEDVGLIKSTIQPLLYFLPIITGALADRFGYRRTLLVAFTLLGGGYVLTSQMTTYTTVFLALCVMGLGAGAFKPMISGTIARVTDEANSTFGFGIYYWSINLGAFLFPLILVPILKGSVGWRWVMVAAAVGTGAMILPTLFLYREPETEAAKAAAPVTDLVQTLANAFEIIYSPVILVVQAARRRRRSAAAVLLASAILVVAAAWQYAAPRRTTAAVPGETFRVGGRLLEVAVDRNMTSPAAWRVDADAGAPPHERLVVFRPEESLELADEVVRELHLPGLDAGGLAGLVEKASKPLRLTVREARGAAVFRVVRSAEDQVEVRVLDPERYASYRNALLDDLRAVPELAVLPAAVVDDLFARTAKRPFLLPFIALVLLLAGAVILLQPRYRGAASGRRAAMLLATVAAGGIVLWLLPGLSLFARIVSSVIAMTVPSLYLMDFGDLDRYRDHWRFLLLIFLYSGFWVLYFQMFDSVLWYVQAYVDASSLNRVVNGVLATVGVGPLFRFDVEHVTVINAGTIILLQLVVSSVVRKTKALPTMITGIAFGTAGMAVLAVSTGIWVFIAGIVIFSIGEMTAHPKFISYVGQIAPRDRVATYMGYIFLYGVIGSSIGGVLGANLYVHWVDQLNRPRILWLIFSSIGIVTILALLLYGRFIHRYEEAE